jgi:predicted RNase H-like HicB family nuclease
MCPTNIRKVEDPQAARLIEDALLYERDAGRWFCIGYDEGGVPRVWARGDSEVEVEQRAREAAESYRAEKATYRVTAPISEWCFVVYAPELTR